LSQETGGIFTYSGSGWYKDVYAHDYDLDGFTDILVVDTLTAWGPPCPSPYSCLWFGGVGRIIRGLGGRMFSSVPMTVFEFLPVVGQAQPGPYYPYMADWDSDGDVDFYGGSLDGMHWFENRALFGAGCPGTTGVPAITINSPDLGNAGFAIGLANALPNAPAILAVSVAQAMSPACGISVGLLPGEIIVPLGSIGYATVSPGGTASVSLPLPAIPQLHGLTLFAQWAVADNSGAFSIGGASYALSRGRTIVLW
jgi:hypothetical protein